MSVSFRAVRISEIAEALGVHKTVAEKRARQEGWAYSVLPGRGRPRSYLFDHLSPEVKAKVLLRYRATPEPVAAKAPTERGPIWDLFERLPASMQANARKRLSAVHLVRQLVETGFTVEAAANQVAHQCSVAPQTVWRWWGQVRKADPADWLAVLAPKWTGRTSTANCDQRAWDWYKGQFLARQQPSHADTYRRLEQIAKAQGWKLPAARTLHRRMDREVDQVTQVLMREGPEAARRLLPTMQRDALSFAAGEGVSGDGLKFDRLWVSFPDGEILNTATGWFWQDIHSRRILAWRVDQTESTDLFRLSTYDLTAVCAPAHATIDNTRVAANKVMTAGAKGRHRFRADPEDGLGLLLMLGIAPQFTNPDRETGNPGAKPIERAFGIGGIHDMVATHPSFAGRGFSKATAIPIDELRTVVAEEVARFNAQPRRRTQACRGLLSFDQAWEAGVAQRPPRKLSEAQRRLLLMSREVVSVKAGAVSIEAGRGRYARNRYWSEQLVQHDGQRLAVLFDPEALSDGAHCYTLDGRYLCQAEHQPTHAFNSTTAARQHGKLRRRVAKSRKAIAENEVRMTALERAALYESATQQPTEPAPAATAPDAKVVEGHFQRVPDPARDAMRATGTDGAPSERESQLADFLRRGIEQLKRDQI